MRALLALAAVILTAPAVAGTVAGSVSVTDKGGHKASDLSDTVISLDGARARPRPAKATMTMKAKSFTPHVVVVPVGGTVEFPNEDPILHNAFSVSGDNRFDLQLYKRPKSGAFTFQHPGIVRVYCNIHPQMSGVIVVRDSPYYTKAGTDGSFVLEGVAAGKYTLRAWHERGGEATLEIVVPADGQVGAQLNLDASAFKQAAHKKKDGSDYASAGDDKY